MKRFFRYICRNCGHTTLEERHPADKDLGTYCENCGGVALRSEEKRENLKDSLVPLHINLNGRGPR